MEAECRSLERQFRRDNTGIQKLSTDRSEVAIARLADLQDRTSAAERRLTEIREEIRAEMENVRSAVKWAIKVWDKDPAREVLKAYYDFLIVHGWHEARDMFIYMADYITTEREDPE